ncbi:peptide chain release factor N(5)-glutamine methyltransferase [Gilvimarinus agarilyticus]|uniref:peptide chain release factor N(5)-glutamine methyltransferase n=1 Tax=unclassified Gilvimarinus TaxID=2642066 RepID=UPI001C0846A5|nr:MULTISPECIES: peptide chain release factor N(5)-glutamine methyltransferase [unclassified Gilvimarinus]MBU2886086.1 peptide chain release factor N(5)-glutamine methyltransferase [Gilvimarinus agarilyticus]MDO6570795.1 peptide chain release factor N(5)-glutamine methyltransferase [Gilvimarinus sp. 2_MG-2023]MDO6746963.1 peptide chain release factor N(5)-glutamine methyltransferase [Gilvimarinus sp. 1_MG-2023]
MRIDQALQQATQALTNSDSARLDAEVLLSAVLDKSRTYFYTWPERTLNDSEQQTFNALIKRRALGEPVAFLTGTQEFWSLPLKTHSQTLIPRPETELLVEQALALGIDDAAQVLDLGTGTGAIALALASERPSWQISAVDRIADSVNLARANAQHLKLNVTIYQSNWFAAVPKHERFALIVSNPPYIDAEDEHLQQGDVRFEPASALVADEAGLADIRRISEQALDYLTPAGYLLFEHGWQQAALVRNLMNDLGYQHVHSVRDLAGIERVTIGQREAVTP